MHPPRDIVLSPSAEADLGGISEYFATRNPIHAEQIFEALLHSTQQLRAFPLSGRSKRRGTRELILRPYRYRLVYQVTDGAIRILRVLHTARQWP